MKAARTRTANDKRRSGLRANISTPRHLIALAAIVFPKDEEKFQIRIRNATTRRSLWHIGTASATAAFPPAAERDLTRLATGVGTPFSSAAWALRASNPPPPHAANRRSRVLGERGSGGMYRDLDSPCDLNPKHGVASLSMAARRLRADLGPARLTGAATSRQVARSRLVTSVASRPHKCQEGSQRQAEDQDEYVGGGMVARGHTAYSVPRWRQRRE